MKRLELTKVTLEEMILENCSLTDCVIVDSTIPMIWIKIKSLRVLFFQKVKNEKCILLLQNFPIPSMTLLESSVQMSYR